MIELLTRFLADGLVLIIVALGVWALLFRVPQQGRYAAYCRVLLAGLTAYWAAKLIGAVYQPEALRPFQQLGLEAGASFLNNPGFPSDHVLFCMAIALAVLFETRTRRLGWLLIGLALLVGVGRVAALVHTPLDVIGSVVIACIGALWYLQGDQAQAVMAKSRKNRKKSVK